VKEDNRANKKNPGVVEYRNPGVALPVADALTEVLRTGARELLQQAVEAEGGGVCVAPSRTER
jgi:hypothetical protein